MIAKVDCTVAWTLNKKTHSCSYPNKHIGLNTGPPGLFQRGGGHASKPSPPRSRITSAQVPASRVLYHARIRLDTPH